MAKAREGTGLLMDVERVESTELCSTCKGRCCKSSPGRYSPEDTVLADDITVERVLQLLSNKTAAVTCGLVGALNSRVAPVFTLAARGMDKPELCLCLGNAWCNHLSSTGCVFSLEDRPFECAAIVPSRIECKMPGNLKMEDLWMPYQDVLRTVIEKSSGRPWIDELTKQINEPKQKDNYTLGARKLIVERGLATSSADITFIVDMAKSLPF